MPLVEGPNKVGDKKAYSKSLLNLLSVEKVKSRKGLWDPWCMTLTSSVVAQLNSESISFQYMPCSHLSPLWLIGGFRRKEEMSHHEPATPEELPSHSLPAGWSKVIWLLSLSWHLSIIRDRGEMLPRTYTGLLEEAVRLFVSVTGALNLQLTFAVF